MLPDSPTDDFFSYINGEIKVIDLETIKKTKISSLKIEESAMCIIVQTKCFSSLHLTRARLISVQLASGQN